MSYFLDIALLGREKQASTQAIPTSKYWVTTLKMINIGYKEISSFLLV